MAQPIIKHPIIDPLLRLLVLYINNIVIFHILAMASIEDLIATISGGLHAGQQGNDIRDLHVSFLARFPTPTCPTFRLFLYFPYPISPHKLARTTSR